MIEHAHPRWYAHGLNRASVYRVVAGAARALPRPARLRLAAAVAPRLRSRFAVEWAAVTANMARIMPSAAPTARRELVADVFRHFAMGFSDLLVANRRTPARRLLDRVDGMHHLEDAARDGRGVILITAHLGNWELAGRLLAGVTVRPTHVVVEAEADPRLERLLRGGPAPVNFVVRSRPTAVLPLVTALRRNEIVALQGDRALGSRGDVAVPFFGAEAHFPLGPFLLARAAGAPLVPAFCVLGRDRRYTVTVEPPIRVERDGERSALERWVAVLERTIRAYPEQWFNFFDAWSLARAS